MPKTSGNFMERALVFSLIYINVLGTDLRTQPLLASEFARGAARMGTRSL